MHPDTAFPYRPDIDGMRAIAVIAVLLFHSGVPGFSGGYVGVDVFFVISGYLITGWLVTRAHLPLRDLLGEFYARRGRRILPAFLFVLGVTTAVAVWLLQPAHLEIFGRLLAHSAVMLANFGARFNGNYFGWTASNMPLLHVWSIAVEEQFYLLYPLAFVAIQRRWPESRRGLLAFGAAVSFALCLWMARTHPVSNYYMLPTRAWELLVGALVALGAWPLVTHRVARELVAVAALTVIVACACLFTTRLEYPAWPTLAPTLATAALVSVGTDGSIVTRLLCWRPLVFTGLISYSLYLWHMPVLGLFRYYQIFALRPAELAALCALIYLLSVATWWWIELPFRRRRWMPRDRWFWAAAAGASAVLLAAGLKLMTDNAYARRLAEAQDAAPRRDLGRDLFPARCIAGDFDNIRRGDLCSFGPSSGAVARAVVWGDSHSWALAPAYRRIANRERIQIFIAQIPSCAPLIGAVSEAVWRCNEFNLAMVSAVKSIHPDLIVLNARWANPGLHLAPSAELTVAGGDSLFSRGLQETLKRVDAPGRAVCVIKGVPAVGYQAEYALEMARRRGISPDFLSLTRTAAYGQFREQEADIDALERRGSIHAVDPKRVLCPGARCRYLTDDGQSIYRDDNHVSVAGARLLEAEVARCFDGSVARAQSGR